MPFTNYGPISLTPGYEGQLADGIQHVTRHFTNADSVVIPFGRAVVLSTASGYLPTDAVLPSTVTTPLFLGISIASQIYEYAVNASGDNGYPIGREIDVITEGDIYVYTEQAVTPNSPVFYRAVAKSGFTALGVFRTDSDTVSSVAHAVQIPSTNARWVSSSGAGTLAILHIQTP